MWWWGAVQSSCISVKCLTSAKVSKYVCAGEGGNRKRCVATLRPIEYNCSKTKGIVGELSDNASRRMAREERAGGTVCSDTGNDGGKGSPAKIQSIVPYMLFIFKCGGGPFLLWGSPKFRGYVDGCIMKCG